MPNEKSDNKVSPNNPCPFLRALVQQDLLQNHVDPIGDVAATIAKVAKTGVGSPKMPSLPIRIVALIANGLSPLSMLKNGFGGVRLDELRNGPLDKKGAGSRILDSHGVVDEAELVRLAQFASDKQTSDGNSELGLDLNELTTFMNDNFARAIGHRRKIDRKLMNGEWPIILKILGQDGQDGRYVSVADIRTLFIDRTFPARMMMKINAE